MKIENFTQLYNIIKNKNVSASFEKSVNDYISECNCKGQLKELKRKGAIANYIVVVNYLNSNKPLAYSVFPDSIIEFYNDNKLILTIKR